MKMIDSLDKRLCTGCALCYDVCPQDAIQMTKDSITGFLYPIINYDKCIGCEKCSKKCPSQNNTNIKNDIKRVYAANNRNLEIRFESTSGGVFSQLANYYYSIDGVVVGAVWKNKLEVVQKASEDVNDLCELRLSKYIQSDSRNIYREVLGFLEKGKSVLFVGCPCQIAAIRQLTASPLLLTVDLVCKGVPSPAVWEKYINFIENGGDKKVILHRSKDKEYGWKRLGVRIDYEDGTADYIAGSDDLFINLYSKNILMRDACYQCMYRGTKRLGDITLGDCWGVESLSPQLDDDCGTSMILINSDKGDHLWKEISGCFDFSEIDKNKIEKYNQGISSNFCVDESLRTQFWNDLNGLELIDLVNKYTKNKKKKGLKDIIRPFYTFYQNLKFSTCFRPKPLFQFVKYNFFSKHIKRDKGCFLFMRHHCNFWFEKKSCIELHGNMFFGCGRQPNSTRESRILMHPNSRIIVREKCHISEGADIEMHKNGLWSMDVFYSNFNLEISCGKHIDMRGDVGAGRKVTIRDYNGHLIAKNGFEISSPVIIENHTWLCSGCTIMPGVHIFTGGIVSANAYVASNVPAYSVMAGKPAVIMGKDVKHKI